MPLSERIARLTRGALALPQAERADYLERQCGEDDDVRQAVEAKLSSLPPEALMFRTGGGLNLIGDTQDDAAGARSSEWIDDYRLEALIGSGGFGEVYAAEQLEPVRRRVALKLLKSSVALPGALSRFDGERHALARMDHPGVAKILDAGETAQGQPYFVMELVDGKPVTDYCDGVSASIRDRVELFIQVCTAVHHAHQKGVIHRDLKPSNILVTEVDDAPMPKVIDFGIAKATSGRLVDSALETRVGEMMGTPAYMSPEQATTGDPDLDTRTDIYSLGVVLYELLTGVLPFDPQRMRDGGYAEMLRALRDDEPPKPSARVAVSSENADVRARARNSDPIGLRRTLRGDLDWIVLKALAKRPGERYDSATALAADLNRYLRSEPVSAGPPSTLYRMGKFARRHMVGLAAAVVIVATVALAFINTLWQRHQTELARQDAVNARQIAEREAAVSAAVADFLFDLISGANPVDSKDFDMSLADAVIAGATRVATGLDDQPVVKARLLRELARSLLELNQLEAIPRLIDQALPSLIDSDALPTHIIADLRVRAGYALYRAGDNAEARRRLSDVINELGDSTSVDDELVVALALRRLGLLERRARNLDIAQEIFQRADERYARLLPDDSVDFAAFLSDYGLVLSDVGDYERAIDTYRQAIAIFRKRLGPTSPRIAMTLDNLSDPQRRSGDLDAAIDSIEQADAIFRAALGEDYGVRQANVTMTRAIQANEKGDFNAATKFYLLATAIYRRELGEEHPRVALSLLNHANAAIDHGRCDVAVPLLREARTIHLQVYGADSFWVARDDEGLTACEPNSEAQRTDSP